jgi:hypothetical protein
MELFSQPHTSASFPPVKEWPVPTEDLTAALDVLEKTKISCNCQQLTVTNYAAPAPNIHRDIILSDNPHLLFTWGCFACWQGVHCLLLFQFATSWCPGTLSHSVLQSISCFTHNIWRRYWKCLPSAPSACTNVSLLTNTLFIRHHSSARFGKSSKPVGSEEQELWDAIISLCKARKCTL